MMCTRSLRLPLSPASAALAVSALLFAAGAFAQSSPADRSARAAARAQALSQAVRDTTVSRTADSDAQTPLDKQKVSLGLEVFRDRSLSEPAGQSCSDCHRADHAFTMKGPTSPGANPELSGFRNAPTITYAMFTPPLQKAVEDGATGFLGGQFRDGHAHLLEDQMTFPLTNPIEMGNPDLATVVAKVAAAPYAGTFREIYGADVFSSQDSAMAAIENAVATYERSHEFQRFDSKYDAYWRGDTTLTDAEQRGLAIFNDTARGNCSTCHLLVPDKLAKHALLTDYGYDNIGLPRNPNNPYYKMPPSINPNGHKFVDNGLNDVIHKQGTVGQFKSPSLRNVAVTGPYGHNGYFKTLRGVIDFYNTRDVRPRCADKFTSEADAQAQGCWPEPEVKENVNRVDLGNLKLSDQDIDDLLTFLNTLTDGWSATAAAAPR